MMIFSMRKTKKRTFIKLSASVMLVIVLTTLFSIPVISVIAPLGDILFPGGGIWRVPGEVPVFEVVHEPSLSGDVIVYRDEWGIPHIYASNESDLFFAQGFCHAQDRFFEMDLIRRQVRGKLSEIIGDMTLEMDKMNLAIGMEYWAIKTDEKMRELHKSGELPMVPLLDRYCDGINYYLNTHQYEKPLEYQLLDFEPEGWTSVDTLCLVQEMARQMSWTYEDLYRLVNYNALGEENYSELFTPTYGQIPICPNYGGYDDSSELPYNEGTLKTSSAVINAISNLLAGIESIPSEKELIDLKRENVIGSNNWVVNGTLSKTGKPLLCDDMHLSWMLPGVWYENHLVCSDTGLNTYGYSIPGMPLVAVGHNEHVAWGFTNTGYDVIDWYFYNAFNESHYIYNGSATPYTTRTHEIKVKGQATEKFIVRETVHGPVFQDFLGTKLPEELDQPGEIIIAPRWIANGYYYNLLAGYGWNYAKNRQEFDIASSNWTILAQNVVYADIDGNIAIRPTGNVSIRDDSTLQPGHPGNGMLPYNGSNGEGEWIGLIPFEELPNCVNPDQCYLVSANQIVAGPDWDYSTYFLQNEYDSGYRARRINELLNNSGQGTIGIEKMKEIQLDVKSTPARAFVPYFINITDSLDTSLKTDIIKAISTQLKNWDYDMDKNLIAPTIYRVWRQFYYDFTFDDEFDAFDAMLKPQLNVLEQLTRDNGSSKWFDDITTNSIIENRSDIIYKALNSTIDFLVEFYGTSDVYSWRYGQLHKLEFPHIAPGMDALGKGPFEGDGEAYTVNPSRIRINSVTDVTTAKSGASMRMIVDLSDMGNSISVIPSGQRGLSNSKHYSDQLEELFLQGKYHRQYFYNDSASFPPTLIESTILFVNIPDMTKITLVTYMILGLFIGVASVTGIWGLKKSRLISKFNKLTKRK